MKDRDSSLCFKHLVVDCKTGDFRTCRKLSMCGDVCTMDGYRCLMYRKA
jgi:hypothetical protein